MGLAIRYGAVALMLVGCLEGPAEVEAPPEDTRSILFLGNSLTYTNDLPAMLDRLLEEGLDEEVYVESVSPPNWGLPDHWAGRGRELVGLGWDVVVLQQGPSATEGRPYLLEYADAFADDIRAAGGVPALYMVWPARARFFDFDGVFDSYRTAAENVDGYFFPAGEAWRVAWETDPDLPLYGPDDFHPSAMGTYLAALVMYEQLTGMDARDVPDGAAGFSMDPADEALLRAAAHEANVRHSRTVGP
jgi:hypothetical protein